MLRTDVLSALQLQVAGIIAELSEADGFALAGGAALILRGEVDRTTRDLDFFGLAPGAVDELAPAVDGALRAAGLSVEHVQQSSGFVRMIVKSEADETEVDLAADARVFPCEPGSPAPTLASEELAADKVLALFGRAEARDFEDVMALEPRHGFQRLCQLAATKDRGFSLEVFAEMLGGFRRLRREEFEIDDDGYSGSQGWSSNGVRVRARWLRTVTQRAAAIDASLRSEPAVGVLREPTSRASASDIRPRR